MPGYADKKDRLSLSAEATVYIHTWRRVNECDAMLSSAITNDTKKFFNAWPVGKTEEEK